MSTIMKSRLKEIVREEIQSIVSEAEKYWMGEVPKQDDFNNPIKDTFVDGKTKMGPWAIMGDYSFKKWGVGLGMGKGQKYQKQPDGKWLKIEG